MARKASSKPTSASAQSSATIGFEATASRVSAVPACAAILRNLCKAMDNLWLATDSRGEAETAEGNMRNQLFSAA